MLCKACGLFERTDGPRCRSCHRAYKNAVARTWRARNRNAVILQNVKLAADGMRLCVNCRKIRYATEFATSLCDGKGRINFMCDVCLSALHAQPSRAKGFTYSYWRRRAYSLNTVARSRMRRELRRPVAISELPYVFKPQVLLAKYNQQNGLCDYCGVEMTATALSCDHCVPLSRGGQHDESNVVLACSDCNQLKATRTRDEFKTFIAEYVQRFVRAIEPVDKQPQG